MKNIPASKTFLPTTSDKRYGIHSLIRSLTHSFIGHISTNRYCPPEDYVNVRGRQRKTDGSGLREQRLLLGTDNVLHGEG